jgi:F-type H+-transporting ATPase subunit epsilon
MAEEVHLLIATPRRAVLDATVLEVTAPGTLGEFGVLPNHAAFLTTLEIGRLTYRDAQGRHHLAVRGGFAEVADNVMTVLAQAAEAAGEIDVARAQADLRVAEAELERLARHDPAESAAAEANRRWALARLDLARPKA